MIVKMQLSAFLFVIIFVNIIPGCSVILDTPDKLFHNNILETSILAEGRKAWLPYIHKFIHRSIIVLMSNHTHRLNLHMRKEMLQKVKLLKIISEHLHETTQYMIQFYLEMYYLRSRYYRLTKRVVGGYYQVNVKNHRMVSAQHS